MKEDKTLAWHRVDAKSLDLRALRVAVVGGTGGIGRAISRFVASRGGGVLVVGQTFRDSDVPRIEFIKADLSLMHEAQRVGVLLPAENLDLVIFTTGIFAAPKREETAEGIERDLAVSFLSRLVILREIGPRLGKDRGSTMTPRVFIMGFPGTGQVGDLDDLNAQKSYRSMRVHMNTVAGNEILVLDATKRYPHANFFGLNPGIIKTNIRSNFLGANTVRYRVIERIIGLMSPSAENYAERLAPLLVSPDLEGRGGAMFNRKGAAILPSPKLTQTYVTEFIEASEALMARARSKTAH